MSDNTALPQDYEFEDPGRRDGDAAPPGSGAIAQHPAPATAGSPRGTQVEWQVLLVILASLVVAAPLLQPGYFWGAHDARHDVYFMFQYDKAVQDGIWLPRWAPDFAFGYGYPFFLVYGPLATFIGELFHHFLGFGYEASVKAVLGLSMLLSGLAMYGFVRSWLGRNAALVAAVAYMAVPYHLVDVFVRAAMAESVALVFLPLVLWGFRETVLRPRVASVVGAAVAYAALMWTSNLVAVVFTPALGLYVVMLILWRARDERPSQGAPRPAGSTWWRGATGASLALALGLGLSAGFFIPALVEQQYINKTQWFGQYYDPTRHFVYLHQLFNPSWGFGISQPGPDDIAQGSMSYQLGAVPLVLSLLGLLLAARSKAATRRDAWFWALWAVGSIGLTLGVSAPLWRHAPLIPYAQFPWRYLMLGIIPLSILSGMVLAERPYSDSDGVTPSSRPDTPRVEDPEQPQGLPTANRERSDRAEPLAWPAVLLAALLLLGSFPYLKVQIAEPTRDQGPVSNAALMRFERTSDEMTGVTAWVDPVQRPHWSPMAELWVQGQEVTTRVDYSQVPQTEELAVNSEDRGSAHEQIYFYTDGPGRSITFNWFWYPGWKAYLLDGKDGRPVAELPVEREPGPLARIVIPIPEGEGYILLRMEDTPLRKAAIGLTLAALVLTVTVPLGIIWARRCRTRRPGGSHAAAKHPVG